MANIISVHSNILPEDEKSVGRCAQVEFCERQQCGSRAMSLRNATIRPCCSVTSTSHCRLMLQQRAGCRARCRAAPSSGSWPQVLWRKQSDAKQQHAPIESTKAAFDVSSRGDDKVSDAGSHMHADSIIKEPRVVNALCNCIGDTLARVSPCFRLESLFEIHSNTLSTKTCFVAVESQWIDLRRKDFRPR